MMYLLDTCAFIWYLQELPLIHGDPFDRLIIATAMREKLTILTDDEKIIRYPNVKVVW